MGLDQQHAQPVGELEPLDRGDLQCPCGSRLGWLAAIGGGLGGGREPHGHGHSQDRDASCQASHWATSCNSFAASSVWPFGTTESTTRPFSQESPRQRPHVGRREGAVAGQVFLEVVGVAGVEEVVVQLIGLAAEAAHPFELAEQLRLSLVLESSQLALRRALILEPGDLLVDQRQHLLEGVSLTGGDDDDDPGGQGREYWKADTSWATSSSYTSRL